jgi:hypothetical protein
MAPWSGLRYHCSYTTHHHSDPTTPAASATIDCCDLVLPSNGAATQKMAATRPKCASGAVRTPGQPSSKGHGDQAIIPSNDIRSGCHEA